MIGGVSDDPATGAVRRTGDADVAESDCSAREIEVHLFGITARFVLMGRFLPESAESPANVTPRRTFTTGKETPPQRCTRDGARSRLDDLQLG